jgi:Ser/Thr protein kinase RdoA (MazF antagonist)
VLFERGEFRGFIDFGSLRPDCAAGDLARLGEDFPEEQVELWPKALTAYQGVRSLAENERTLVRIYDLSSRLLSGLNWIRWIAIEQRQFPDRSQVRTRWLKIIARLSKLKSALDTRLEF